VFRASLDHRLRLLDVDEGFVRYFNRTRESIMLTPLLDLLDDVPRATIGERLSRLLSGEESRFRISLAAGGRGVEPLGIELTGIVVGRSAIGAPPLIVLIGETVEAGAEQGPIGAEPTHILSELDARILEGIAVGESSARIASQVFLSRQGVEYRIQGLLRRFDAPSRSALISRAFNLGVLDAGAWPPKVFAEGVESQVDDVGLG